MFSVKTANSGQQIFHQTRSVAKEASRRKIKKISLDMLRD